MSIRAVVLSQAGRLDYGTARNALRPSGPVTVVTAGDPLASDRVAQSSQPVDNAVRCAGGVSSPRVGVELLGRPPVAWGSPTVAGVFHPAPWATSQWRLHSQHLDMPAESARRSDCPITIPADCDRERGRFRTCRRSTRRRPDHLPDRVNRPHAGTGPDSRVANRRVFRSYAGRLVAKLNKED